MHLLVLTYLLHCYSCTSTIAHTRHVLLQVAGTFDDFLALREGTQQSNSSDEAQLPFSVGTGLGCEEDSVVICGPLLWCIKRHTVDTNCSEVRVCCIPQLLLCMHYAVVLVLNTDGCL
jgi:hypothetical protein